MKLKRIEVRNYRKLKNSEANLNVAKGSKERLVGDTSTLIVGQNNAGKTTLLNALISGIKENKLAMNDVNFEFLDEARKTMLKGDIPDIFVEIDYIISLDNLEEDELTNLYEFVDISEVIKPGNEVKIKARFIAENIGEINFSKEDLANFDMFFEKVKCIPLKKKFFNSNNNQIKNFNLSNLIDVTLVKANNLDKEEKLSDAFTKIIKYKINHDDTGMKTVEDAIAEYNDTLKKSMEEMDYKLSVSVNPYTQKENIDIDLSPNLSIDDVLKRLVKYSYKEGKFKIPESQFGLGYTNLILIIAEVIDYVQRFDEKNKFKKISILAIEEPETFMHPQMQAKFILDIDSAISKIIENHSKDKLEIQTIITTHSNNILNSKLDSSESFDNIIYFNNLGTITNFSNEMLFKGISEQNEQTFIRKHVRLETSGIFFADAVILVEGITEKLYLRDLLLQDTRFSNYVIDVYLVNGTHANQYIKLLDILKIPTLIITDLDIQNIGVEESNSTDTETYKEKKLENVSSLEGRKTTNPILGKINLERINEKLEDLDEEKNNIFYVTQNESIGGFYATSFEESIILTNHEDTDLEAIIKKLKPDLLEKKGGLHKGDSRYWQKKLEKSKFNFMSEILPISDRLNVPDYINSGLNKLSSFLEMGNDKDEKE